jgi:anaerobic selenocysteine-containing dehydrogenase
VISAGAETETHCPYCALQCGMTLTRTENGLQVAPRDFPSNRGGLCRKGWTSAELLSSSDRLTTPLVRRAEGGELAPASWQEAIGFVASSIRALSDRYGPSSLGVFGGGGLTNEKAYMLGKFARVVLRTKNIDYNGRFCMAPAAVASQKVFGIDRGLPFPVSDIADADVVFLAGANPAETMPPLMQYFDAQKKNGGRLIVSDPRRTPTAAAATLHLQLTPGTDVALANGMLYLALREKLVDLDFIRDRTRHFELASNFLAVEQRDPAEIPDESYPLFLTTGRLLAHYQSGNQTRRVAELREANPESFVEIHPDTALVLGVADGERVRVVTRRGQVVCNARLTATIRRDTVFMPFHFSGAGRANTLTSDAVDPVSKIPAFKLAAARLERVPVPTS